MEERDHHILYVGEDREVEVSIQQAVLRIPGKRFQVEAVSCQAAMRVLYNRSWEALLIDLDCPDHNSLLSLVYEIRRRVVTVPVFLLTNGSSTQLPIETIGGTIETLEKYDLSPAVLQQALHHTLERNRLLQALNRTLTSMNTDHNGPVQSLVEMSRQMDLLQTEDTSFLQGGDPANIIRQVLEILPVGVWLMDTHGRIIYGNPANRQIWAGVRYVGMDSYGDYNGWWVDSGEPIAPSEWASARAISRGEISIDEEVEIECLDKTHKIILNSALPLRDRDHEIIGAVIINQDITARKRYQEALQESNELLETVFSSIHLGIAYLDRNFNFLRVNRIYAEAGGHSEEYYAGKNHFELYPHPENEAIFRTVMETGEPYFVFARPFEFSNDLNQGVTYWDWSLYPVRDSRGEVNGLVLSMIDVTENQHNRREIEALAELSQVLSETRLDYDKVLNIIVRRVVDLLGDNCTLTLIREARDGPYLESVAYFDNEPEAMALLSEINHETIIRVGEGIAGKVAETGEPVLLSAIDANQYRDQIKPAYLPYLDQFGLYSVLVVPLRVQDRVIGTLGVNRKTPNRPYTQRDQTFLEDLANRAALSITNSQLLSALRNELNERKRMEAELAEIRHRLIQETEDERLRLAQELHDGPMQDLYSLTFQLMALPDNLEAAEMDAFKNTFHAHLLGIIQTLRNTSSELRPAALVPYGLEKAIRSHIEQFKAAQPDLEILLELDQDEQALPELTRLALFRIYQVAITNVVRHAQATRVTILLQLNAKEVILEIKDDGVGFRMPPRWIELAREGHMGLVGAAERAEAIGGHLEIRSAPGQGCLIRVTAHRDPLQFDDD